MSTAKDKQAWVDEVMASIDQIKRVTPDEGLYEKVMDRIATENTGNFDRIQKNRSYALRNLGVLFNLKSKK